MDDPEETISKKMKMDSEGNSNPISQDDHSKEIQHINDHADEEEIKANIFIPENAGFEILSSETIFENMIKIVEQAKEIMSGLPNATLITLLNHVKWDTELLVENYYGDQEKFLKDAKVIVLPDEDNTSMEVSALTVTPSPLDPIDCGICYESVQLDQSSAMLCGHYFCKSCWKSYLTNEVMDKGESQMISCPENGCSIIIGHEMIKNLMSDEPLILCKYRQLISSNFVDSNRRLRWCTGAGCGKVVAVEEVTWRFAGITCSCGQNFCFLCGKDWHEPIKCDLLVRWLKKCVTNDQGTIAWMQTNTKDCPKCKTMIEKNGGCNKMTCRNRSCRHEFCWNCMRSWYDHKGNAYSCNKFDDEGRAQAGDTRAALKRFNHYKDRYMAQQESLKFESKLQETVREKMTIFQNDWKMSWVDAQFFETAARTLCRCRKTLQYTYAYAYFLEKTNQQEIFENNQRDLESATETLSGYLENELIPDGDDENDRVDPVAIKLKVVNSGAYCETRRVVLISHVQDGYDENFWTYRDDARF